MSPSVSSTAAIGLGPTGTKVIEVTEDKLSFDVIRDAVLGPGHFLGHAQTLACMKSDYVYPEISCRSSANEWQLAGSQDTRKPARERVRKILSEHYLVHIAEDVDTRKRAHYNFILPKERVRDGNGVWRSRAARWSGPFRSYSDVRTMSFASLFQ